VRHDADIAKLVERRFPGHSRETLSIRYHR
jgi:hypothetical protein